jgi:hypothetical protein
VIVQTQDAQKVVSSADGERDEALSEFDDDEPDEGSGFDDPEREDEEDDDEDVA